MFSSIQDVFWKILGIQDVISIYDSVSKGGVRSMMQVLKIKFVYDTDFLLYI